MGRSGRKDPTKVVEDIGRRIAELRDDRGWTQEQCAERLGVTRRYLARLERGQQNFTVHRLVWLASHLGCALPDLFLPPRTRHVRVGRPPRRNHRKPA